ncbi:MAG: FG-GAP repeat protein [Deltaproteobacteria bacterium]|nr:FG-GAP repeat protein [Deltaproteobacteria bacterium]
MWLFLLACAPEDTSKDSVADTEDTSVVDDGDRDGDGVPDEADCDPDNNNVYPGHAEIPYNGRDDDCDGYDLTDVDGDGYDGDSMEGGTDCDDSNPTVNPGAPEACYNELDDNCDGWEGGNDCDGDGWERGRDCDDEDPGVHPEQVEVWYDGIDADCEGDDDYDQDHDDEQASDYGGTDCNDLDAAINAAAAELWNGIDDDCEGSIDGMSDAVRTMEAVGDSGAGEGMFGAALAFVPDIDGDGRMELAIGAPQTSDYAGRVWILPTEDGNITASLEGLAVGNGEAESYLGASLLHASAGGGTLAVGAPAFGADTGAVYLLDPAAFTGGPAAISFDLAVSTIAHAEAGGTLAETRDGVLVLGCTTGATTTALSAWDDVPGGRHGIATADFSVQSDLVTCLASGLLGDVDGDGGDDIGVLVDRGDRGVALVSLASDAIDAGGAAEVGDFDAHEGAGLDAVTSLLALPDIDGDGYDEAALSAPGASAAATGDGRVYVVPGGAFDGATSDLLAAATATVSGGTDSAALRASGLADIDGDGTDDLLLGAPGPSELYFTSFAALALGGDQSPLRSTPSFTTQSSSHQLGVAALGEDIDHDGDTDLAISTGRVPGGVLLFAQE